MTERIKTLSDEVNCVNRALLALHKSVLPPPQINDSVSSWRRIALLHLGGQVDGGEITRADILQVSGQITGQLYKTVKRDSSGRAVTHFYGSPQGVWLPFRLQARKVVAIHTKGKM